MDLGRCNPAHSSESQTPELGIQHKRGLETLPAKSGSSTGEWLSRRDSVRAASGSRKFRGWNRRGDFRASRRTVSLALHAAAGIVLAVVAVEILPEALEVERGMQRRARGRCCITFSLASVIFVAFLSLFRLATTRSPTATSRSRRRSTAYGIIVADADAAL